jgi:hypothetical protein
MNIQPRIYRRIFRPVLFVTALGLTLFALTATWLVVTRPGEGDASSHREAPLISQDPSADTTDVYAFVDPNDSSQVNLIANWIPFEGPEGGPNYHRFADDVLYEIHVDNDGDARSEITYQFKFTTTGLDNSNTFLYNTNAVTGLADPDLTVKQTFVVTEQNFATSVTKTLGSNLAVPPVNIGDKSTPNYSSNFAPATIVHNLVDGAPIGKVFAGPRDDPFYVDLGSIFDLLSLRGQAAPIGYGTKTKGVDGLGGYNVHSIALQVPISRLTAGGDPVIGVWATSSRRAIRTLGPLGLPVNSGNFVQISRLGMPLTNEVVMPLALKDAFNGLKPDGDLALYTTGPDFLLQNRVENPEIGRLLCTLYGVPLPASGGSCNTTVSNGTPRSGRGDIFDIFLTGMKLAPGKTFTIITGGVGGTPTPVVLDNQFNINQPAGGATPAEMLRLNTSISGSLCSPAPSRLGVLGGDACGFPNGRRLADDVVEIELLAVAGAAYGVLDGRDTVFSFNSALIDVLTDSIDSNDKPFLSQFPYLAAPHQGQNHVHDYLYFPYFFPTIYKN